jgi:hypothetical protein
MVSPAAENTTAHASMPALAFHCCSLFYVAVSKRQYGPASENTPADREQNVESRWYRLSFRYTHQHMPRCCLLLPLLSHFTSVVCLVLLCYRRDGIDCLQRTHQHIPLYVAWQVSLFTSQACVCVSNTDHGPCMLKWFWTAVIHISDPHNTLIYTTPHPLPLPPCQVLGVV